MFPTLKMTKFEQPSLQYYECSECHHDGYTYKDDGYCLAWTWVYLELRVLNPTKTRTELILDFRLKFYSLGVYIRQCVDYVRSYGMELLFDNLSYDKHMIKLPNNTNYIKECYTKTKQGLKCPITGCESFCQSNASKLAMGIGREGHE